MKDSILDARFRLEAREMRLCGADSRGFDIFSLIAICDFMGAPLPSSLWSFKIRYETKWSRLGQYPGISAQATASRKSESRLVICDAEHDDGD
jgi:hypothetical protein